MQIMVDGERVDRTKERQGFEQQEKGGKGEEERFGLIALLRRASIRITPQRLDILNVFLLHKNQPLAADEIYRLLVKQAPHISPDTVYRNLQLFSRVGILRPINLADGKNRYELSSGEHYHHLVCLKCGTLKRLNFCPLEYLNDEMLADFAVLKHNFEIYGYCATCRREEGES